MRGLGSRISLTCWWLGWYRRAGERVYARGTRWWRTERFWVETSWVQVERLGWACGSVAFGGGFARLMVGNGYCSPLALVMVGG